MNRILWALLILVGGWAALATWKWQNLSTQLDQQLEQDGVTLSERRDLSSEDRVSLLRHVAEKWLTYDESSFGPQQAAVADLMSPELRRRETAEISRLLEKARLKKFSQIAEVDRIQKEGEDLYRLWGRLNGQEASSKWTLEFQMQTRLESQRRSLKNPWGARLTEMKITTAPLSLRKIEALSVSSGSSLRVQAPCPLEKIEKPPGEGVLAELNSMDVREVSLRLQKTAESPRGPQGLRLFCRDSFFQLALGHVEGGGLEDLFFRLTAREAQPVESHRKAKTKSKLIQSLESEFGLIVEDDKGLQAPGETSN